MPRLLALASKGARTGVNLRGCAECRVAYEDGVVDSDRRTATRVDRGSSHNETATLRVDYGTTLPAATWAGFDLKIEGDVGPLDLVSQVRVVSLIGGRVSFDRPADGRL